jgi:hypothetical protein
VLSRFIWTALTRAKISWLVRQLNSDSETDAKRAASMLDQILYPNYGPGPRVVSAAESQQIQDRHYGVLRGSIVLGPLLNAAHRGKPFARAYALTALGAIGDIRAQSLPIAALSNGSLAVRLAATNCLRFWRQLSSTEHLIPLLNDPDNDVRQSAARTLGCVGSVDTVPALMSYFERGGPNDKAAALHALGQIADPRSLPLARDALVNADHKVRKAAKAALASYDMKRRSRPSALI